MSIVKFGKRERVSFESAGLLDHFAPPAVPAVYALTYKQEPGARPKAHTVLYFGHSDDMSKQHPGMINDVREWWLNRGGEAQNIFVFVHSMPGSSQTERTRLHSLLVSEYSPNGNY